MSTKFGSNWVDGLWEINWNADDDKCSMMTISHFDLWSKWVQTGIHEFGICWCDATRWAKLEQNLKPQARKTHEHLKNAWSYGVVFGV